MPWKQIEDVLHGFKLTLAIFAAVAAVLLLAAAALTNLYLTRNLFRHIAQPLDTLTAGAALSIRVIRTALQKHRAAMIWFILGLMLGSLYAIIMEPTSLQTPQPVRCWASPSESRYTVRRDRAYARDLPAAADTKTVKRRKSSFFFLSGLINGNCCGILGINWRKRGRSMC